jgi:hypothetical protein
MSSIPQRQISFTAGQTFFDQVIWCQGARVYKQVASVTTGLPTKIRVPGHGIPLELTIAVWFDNFVTAKGSFSSGKHYFAFAEDENTIVLIDDNTTNETISQYGTMFYIPPVDLLQTTVYADFKYKASDTTALIDASSLAPNAIFEIVSPGLIRMELTPAHTKTLIGSSRKAVSGVAQIELHNEAGQVFRPWDYAWEVHPEGTRE